MTTQNDKAKASSLRARAAVAAWRDQNPAGTAGQLTATLSGQFHRDYGPAVRGAVRGRPALGPGSHRDDHRGRRSGTGR